MTRRTQNFTRRGAAVATLAVASAAFLTGCGQMTNAYTTDLQYDPADGISATVGDLKTVDLLIVNDGKSQTGKVSGLVYNSGNDERTLTLSAGGAEKTVKVGAGQSVRLDGKTNGNGDTKASAVTLSSLGGAKPGEQVAVTLRTTPGGSTRVEVPVLLDQAPYGSAKVQHAEDPQLSEKQDAGIAETTPPPTGKQEKGTSVTGSE